MLLQDLRFALRSFLRAPRFTVPALVALALGIGATSAIFSIVRGVILKPLPYRDPERIVAIWEHRVDRNRPRNVIAPGELRGVAGTQQVVRAARHGDTVDAEHRAQRPAGGSCRAPRLG